MTDSEKWVMQTLGAEIGRLNEQVKQWQSRCEELQEQAGAVEPSTLPTRTIALDQPVLYGDAAEQKLFITRLPRSGYISGAGSDSMCVIFNCVRSEFMVVPFKDIKRYDP